MQSWRTNPVELQGDLRVSNKSSHHSHKKNALPKFSRPRPSEPTAAARLEVKFNFFNEKVHVYFYFFKLI